MNERDSHGRMPGPGDMRQAMGRLAALFTGAMPPGVPRDYLVVPTGPLLSGTAVPAPMTQFQARPSGLLVPAELARPPAPFDEVGFFLTGSEILGVSREEFAARFPPECIETLVSASSLEAIALFVAISLWHLHRFGVDTRKADRELVGLYLPPQIADKVRALLREDPHRRFLAPQVLLVLLKIACQVDTNDPLAALPTGMPKIAAMLALAEYLGVNESGSPAQQNAAIGRPGRLGRTVISTQIFHANPDEAYLMGRFYRRWLDSPTADPTDGQVCDLPALFEHATGVPLGDWITVGLGLFSLLQDLPQPRIAPAEYAQRIGWPAARLEAVLQLVCVDTAILRDLVVRETVQLGRDWAFGTFERYPLLRLRDGSVLVLDPHLLVRRFFSWLPLFDLQTRAHTQTQEAAWRKRYALRAGIEGTICEFANGHGMRHCRYRGRGKTHVQHVLTAIAVNIERLSQQTTPHEPRRPRPPTAFQSFLDHQNIPRLHSWRAVSD